MNAFGTSLAVAPPSIEGLDSSSGDATTSEGARGVVRLDMGAGRDGEEEAEAVEIARLQASRRATARGDGATREPREEARGEDSRGRTSTRSTRGGTSTAKAPLRAYAPSKDVLEGAPLDAEDDEDLESDEALGFGKSRRVIDRESDYSKRRLKRKLSPGRDGKVRAVEDGSRGAVRFSAREEENSGTVSKATVRREGVKTMTDDGRYRDVRPRAQDGDEGRSYADRMKEAAVDRERDNTLRNIERKQREEAERAADAARLAATRADEPASSARPEKRKRRWDAKPDDSAAMSGKAAAAPPPRVSEWESDDSAATGARWDDATPRGRKWEETPQHASQWDTMESGTRAADAKQTPRRSRSRWDETPQIRAGGDPSATPVWTGGETPVIAAGAETPKIAAGMATPSAAQIAAHQAMQSNVPLTPEQYQQMRYQREIEERNRPQTDEELDELLPSEGFKIIDPPASYVPIRTPARKLMQTPMPYGANAGFFSIPEEDRGQKFDVSLAPEGLPEMKPEDVQYFAPLLKETDDEAMTIEEQKERKIMRLLLRVKNGTPQQRKSSLRQITDRAKEFGAGPLFNQILPLLMSPTLEDQERHLLVKVIDRILYKLDDLVRPYVHKILVVIEPLLIDEDYYARMEGREIIGNLSKAAGLATMIAAMRPDIDNVDEYVRNTTARAFAVVAQALGVQSLLPFLKAVCRSKKSWQARHTGIKIVQQIAILHGCAVLPHLKSLVDIIEQGLGDENQKVRTITALSIAALAEAATPYGIESFDNVLKPLWKGIRAHRGKVLAAFLKAIGFIIPLMDAMYANYYTREVMVILIREFATADEEMKKITLKVVKQCVATDGVEPEYIRAEVMPEFFKHFWVRRMALDRRNYQQLVETTLEISLKVGAAEIIGRIVEDLKDESEPYRRMVMETITKVIEELGTADVDTRMEELLIDGMLYSFQEQTTDEGDIMLKGVGTIVNALGLRAKPYLPQICGTIKWRMNNKAADIREQAADLISAIAPVMRKCEEEQLLGHLGVVLYEYLGEEYPEVLGSILGALKAIVSVQGMTRMTPPIKDLLPRLTPILKNRHEKVQENTIDLIGRIADRGAEYVAAREWMRICFELLELLKAPKKAIRRATVNTFGYIAKAIGPQDVLATLLNNLKVQERQMRVCTTVAIAIVAETCAPFTVLPALMNEYRVPELNVQNGVLKSLAFLFEYIGEMGKDYIYAVTPLLEDALMDRDLVHRQTAAVTVKHLALGCAGLGCEDAVTHLINYTWPNVFEPSPHVINAVTEAIEAARVALGPQFVLAYTLQGLFHPARKVRDIYWKIYNTLYIGSEDALVPAYPSLEDDGANTYRRVELDCFV